MGFRKAGFIQRKPARDSRVAVVRPAAPESPLYPPVARYSNRAGGRIVQAKLAVAHSGGSYEQDADRAADQWLRKSKRPIRVQTIMAGTWKEGIAMAPEDSRRIDWLRGQGAPLPPALRRQFESRMQRSLASVRVHAGAEAAELAAMLEARAFATGNDIFFGAGEWQPHTPSGQRLLAHELAHTVQQTQSVAGPGVQRAEKGVLQSIKETAAGVVSEGAALVGQAAMALVRRFAPGIAKIIDQGPFEYIKSKVTSALQDWLPSLFQGFGIDAILAKARTGIGGILAKLDDLRHPSQEACKDFANTLGTIRDFITDLIDNPVIEFLRTGIAEFQATMSKVAAFVVAPIFDFLRDQAVSTWNTIKAVASWIWSGIKAVKDLAGDALDFVLKQLGIDTGESSGEEGVWGWFKRKASQAWNAIKEALAPVVAPIKTAVTVALALSPLGPLYVVIRYGPQVVKSIQWLWEHRDDPDIVKKAHSEMGNTILPGILDAVTNADIKLKEGVDWLTGKFEEIATAVLDFVGKLTGLPLLGTVQSLAAKASDALKETVAWGRDTLKKGAEFFRKIVADISKKIEPYKKVLSSLALALVNPPMIPVIIAGWAWKAIPKCFKIPIIDFILDIVITALTKAPDLPFMGPLWPLLKSAVVAALETFRKQDDDTKEKLSNKIAEIISGASPDFLIGFVKGFLTGVWETLTDPIKAIWSIIEGLNKLLELFDKWTGGGETQVAKAVPKANTAAAGASVSTAAAAPPAVAAPPMASPASAVPDQAAAAAPSAEPGAAAGGQEAEPVTPADAVQLTPQDETSLGERLGQMGKELQPPAKTVTSQFWDAAQQYFSADGGTSFPQLVAKLGEAWEAVKSKIEQESSELTKKLIAYLLSGTADGEIGDKLGWLTGMVVTQLVLDYLTAGTTEVLKPLQAIAKFLNWPMELLGKAFKLIGKLGKYVVSWIKKMGGMVKDAAAGAFLAVKDALGVIGSKLVEFAEEIIARFSKFGKKGAGAAVKEGEHLGEAGLAKAAGQEGKALGKAEQKAAQKGEGVVADAEAAAQKDAKKAAEGEKKTASKEAKKAAELPEAMAEAKAIVQANDLIDTPVPLLVAELLPLQSRFKWIDGFKATPKAIPGHYEIMMLASKHTLAKDYTTGRLKASTLDDIQELRKLGPQDKPPVSPKLHEKYWQKYTEYFENRLTQLEKQVKGTSKQVKDAPLDFKHYVESQEKLKAAFSGTAAQAERSEEIAAELRRRAKGSVHATDPALSDVPTPKRGSDKITKPDDLVKLPADKSGLVANGSTKRRAFEDLSELDSTVEMDVHEAIKKYGGTKFLRTQGLEPLKTGPISADTVFLTYIEDAIRTPRGMSRKDLLRYIKEVAEDVAAREYSGQKFVVMFWGG